MFAATFADRAFAFILDAVLIVATLIVGWLLWFAHTAPHGATPGKVIVGLRVTDTAGGDVSEGAIWAREILLKQLVWPIMTIATLGIWSITWLWPAFDRERQALYDKAVGTVVVRGLASSERAAAYSGAWWALGGTAAVVSLVAVAALLVMSSGNGSGDSAVEGTIPPTANLPATASVQAERQAQWAEFRAVYSSWVDAGNAWVTDWNENVAGTPESVATIHEFRDRHTANVRSVSAQLPPYPFLRRLRDQILNADSARDDYLGAVEDCAQLSLPSCPLADEYSSLFETALTHVRDAVFDLDQQY